MKNITEKILELDILIGELLKEKREDAKMSIADLSIKANIPKKEVEMYETGKLPIALTILTLYCKNHNIDIDQLKNKIFNQSDFQYETSEDLKTVYLKVAEPNDDDQGYEVI